MKKVLILLLFANTIFTCFSQNEWKLINPLPSLATISDQFFINSQEGWFVGDKGTIYYTQDGGESLQLQFEDEDKYFYSVFFISDNEGWAVGWSSIYHTTNKGETWIQQNKPSVFGDMMDVYFINDTVGWIAGTYNLILKTINGGKNWTVKMHSMATERCFNKVWFINDTLGFVAGGETIVHGGLVMRTEDGGETWIESTFENYGALNDLVFTDSVTGWTCGYGRGLLKTEDAGLTWILTHEDDIYYPDCIDFFDANRGVVINGSQVQLTFDGGETWDSLASNCYYTSRSLCCIDSLTCYSSGQSFDLSKSEDGGTNWLSIVDTIKTHFEKIGFFNNNDGYAIPNVYGGRILRTNDGGYNWYYDTILNKDNFYDMTINGDFGYLLSWDHQLVFTSNAGETWNSYNLPDENDYYHDFTFVDENVGYLCSDSGSFFKTSNGGEFWENKSFNEDYFLKSLVFVNELKGWLIDSKNKQILGTTDGGSSWFNRQLGDLYIFDPISIYFINDSTGFVATDEGVMFKTTDSGLTWERHYVLSYGINTKMYFVNEMQGWLHNGSRVYYTDDGGDSWKDEQHFFYTEIFSICFYERKAWLGGAQGLVAVNDFLTDIETQNYSTTVFNTYPNPANDFVVIESENSQNTIAGVDIYNMTGQKVSSVTGIKTTGSYKLNLSGIPTGVYLLQINSKSQRELHKIVIK